MIRHYTKIGLCVIGMILAVVFVVRGIIIPIAHHVAGGGSSDQTVQAQADTEEVQANSDAAVRQPLKGKSDTDKIAAMTAGWHEDANGKWYQNTDGTYFSNGFQDIDGVTYSFDENGYIQTGWVEKGVKDYYFNEDGSYDPSKVRPMLALTFDDGPGEYTDELLDCLEQNNAHATFFMLGQNVSSYPDAPKRMLELGCEIGSHSWDHTQLTTIDLDAVAKQFSDTDDALIQACGQAASVARAPYGDGNSDIYNTVNKPFFMWSLDTEDWKLLDADADYSAVMNGDLTDGTIILMHDIHEPSVKAALRLIPDLIAQGYKLVTVSEMAEAKNVTLQNACYVDFWPSTLSNGDVPGYQGGSDAAASADGTDGTSDASADSSDGSTDSSDGSEDYSDGSSDDGSYDDGSSDDESYDDGSSDDSEDYSDDSVDYGDGTFLFIIFHVRRHHYSTFHLNTTLFGITFFIQFSKQTFQHVIVLVNVYLVILAVTLSVSLDLVIHHFVCNFNSIVIYLIFCTDFSFKFRSQSNIKQEFEHFHSIEINFLLLVFVGQRLAQYIYLIVLDILIYCF